MLNISATRFVEHVDYNSLQSDFSEVQEVGEQAQTGVNFSEMLSEALREETARMASMASVPSGLGSSGMPAGMMGMDTGTSAIEQMILASASNGEVSNAQIALFMLMMMMQSSEGGDMSMLSTMMSALLPQLENEASSSNANRHIDPRTIMMSNSTGAGGAVLPLSPGAAATPVVTSNANDRSPERYRAVVNQFRVETAERYEPFRDGYTYCNIFVLDVTRAMGVHIPHLGAIKMCEWLGTKGAEHGWREVDAETAQLYANLGKPAVTSAGSRGHVQMVVPSRDGGYDPVRGVTIAQAGTRVTNYTHISTIYGANALQNQIRYFVND